VERPLDPPHEDAGADGFLPWSAAMDRALYGPEGFFRRPAGPAAHFRTSVHASPLFAAAVLRLLRETHAALGQPSRLSLVDVGAGRAELLGAVLEQLGDDPLAGRLDLVAVELADRPEGLDPRIAWVPRAPKGISGLIIANEWLDNVPCDVVELGPDGPRLVEVAADGTERLGREPNDSQQAWLECWWPTWRSGEPGERAEIGLMRDAAWADTVAALDEGVAVAIDYAHAVDTRPPFGSLTGYADGRQVPPVPDGTRDLTAHVALDACAAAAQHVADWTWRLDQRSALRRLGVSGARPELSKAAADPLGYLRALSRASAAAELTDPAGLGGFGWLVQGVAVPIPASLED
jgi:SAM-dependent MidA family methyltransferase